ncbi:Tripartite ATP-independent periplasmic transporters, DctQ component [Marinomonas aquimarina]|uniref:TRAP transporter small permease protein n=1 Tax=Marinomonas aquimarina TaxID=295068 RepID=A0A1A8TN26_9GAMM|nr:TRAP transporter small permease subunit [Marinomonas aquimarina]SBS35188.1 Tripartite ATP-independent periplasmic transporters, DctQ component [Marinomonas aquimarina]
MNTETPIPHPEDTADQPRNLLDKAIVRIGNTLSLLFLFTVAISFYEVVMRYVFNAPTIWVHESASFIGACLFVFGGVYALATNKHVRVVLIYDAVSHRTRQYLNVFHHIMGLIFSGLLSYAAFQMTESAVLSPFGDIHFETSGSAWNPAFPAYVKITIFITMCVMFIQFALHFIQEVLNLRKS